MSLLNSILRARSQLPPKNIEEPKTSSSEISTETLATSPVPTEEIKDDISDRVPSPTTKEVEKTEPILITPPNPNYISPSIQQILRSKAWNRRDSLNPTTKTIVSAIENNEPVLKFSDLLQTNQEYFIPKKKARFQKHEPIEINAEADQEALFHQTVEIPLSHPVMKESKLMAQPLSADGTGLSFSIGDFDHILDPIQHIPWEEKICWKEDSSSQKDSFIPHYPKKIENSKNLWGELQPDSLPTVNFSKEPTLENNQSSGAINVLSRPHNDEIENRKWIEYIIWDNNKPIPPQPDQIIFDFNDKTVFPVLPTFEKAAKVKTKKRKVETTEMDKFNLSNDQFYEKIQSSKQSLKKTTVTHSIPALKLSLVKTHLTDLELENFHRPKTTIVPKEKIRVEIQSSKEDEKENRIEVFRKTDHLSLKDNNKFVLMEYIEQHPLILNNVGMGSKIKNYYRKKDPNDKTKEFNTQEGENVFLDDRDESPFLGNVLPGTLVQSLENAMFRAPIFPHTIPETDFILVRNGGKTILRPIPRIYTVGQIQPKMEVPAPNSKSAINFLKNRLQSFICRLFLKKSSGNRIKMADIMKVFPGTSETAIRKRLKECAAFQRGGDDSGWWTITDQSQLLNEDELRAIMTPEMVCLNESMQAGQYRLKQANIKELTNLSSALTMAIHQLQVDAPEEIQLALHYLEEELSFTPWNLTSNFVNAMQGKGMIALKGAGDPSRGRGEAFSYFRAPQKNIQPKNVEKKKFGQRPAVTGTDADLRKLSLEESKRYLLNFGVPESVINSLSRWRRIGLIREKSGEAAFAGEGVTKFARDSRFSLSQQQEQHKEKIQIIFQNQIKALAPSDPEFSDEDEDEDDSNDELVSALNKIMEQSQQRRKKRKEQDEEELLEAEVFKQLREELNLNKPKKSKQDQQAPPQSGNQPTKKQLRIKKIIKKPKPDGSFEETVEYITDPKKVEEYMKKEEEKKKKTQKTEKKKIRGEEKKTKKEKKRLEAELNTLTKREEIHKKIKSGGDFGGIPTSSNKSIKCGACGAPGHMRTNRICPLYQEPSTKSKTDSGSEIEFDIPATSSIISTPSDETIKKDGSKPLVLKIKAEMLSLKRSSEYDISYRNPRRRRTGVTGAKVELAGILAKVCAKISSDPLSRPFLQPVSTKEAPDYYQVIEKPMDLTTLKTNIQRQIKYESKDQFLNDFNLIIENCYKYNKTRNPHLLPAADHLAKICRDALTQYDQKIQELEVIIKSNDESSQMSPNQPFSPIPTPLPQTPFSPNQTPFSPNQTSPPPTLFSPDLIGPYSPIQPS